MLPWLDRGLPGASREGERKMLKVSKFRTKRQNPQNAKIATTAGRETKNPQNAKISHQAAKRAKCANCHQQ